MDLEDISKQYRIDINELRKVEDGLRKKYSSVANIVPSEQIEKYIAGGIKQHVDRFKNLGLTQFFGVVLTLSQPKDGVAKRRSTIVKNYLEDPDGTIARGSVQEYTNGMKRYLVNGMVKSVACLEVPKNSVYLLDIKQYLIPTDER